MRIINHGEYGELVAATILPRFARAGDVEQSVLLPKRYHKRVRGMTVVPDDYLCFEIINHTAKTTILSFFHDIDI